MPERLQPLQYLLLPLLVLGGLYYSLPQLPIFASPWEQLLPWLPYLLGGLIALLGWHFNSARSLLASVLILLCDLALRQNQIALSTSFSAALLTLLPLNMAMIAWYNERGLLNPVALARLAIIGLQFGALIAMLQLRPEMLQQWLFWQPAELAALPAPLIPGVLVTVAGLALLIRIYRHQGRFDTYLLLSACCCCALILYPLTERQLSLVTSTLMALWLFGLLRHSHSLAYLDELTSLPGRRAFNDHLARVGKQHCLAMLDVDHFKKFNDTHGHDVGDQVLKLVAAKLAKVRLGKAYRYGGEEFCVVFPGRYLEQTLEPLEEVRLAIEQARLQLRSTQRPSNNQQGKKMRSNAKAAKASYVSVTISIGVAEHRPGQDTLKAADKALYKAKEAGRNQICH